MLVSSSVYLKRGEREEGATERKREQVESLLTTGLVYCDKCQFLCACLSVDAVLAVYHAWKGIHFQFIQFKKWIFCKVYIFSPREEEGISVFV